MITKYNPLTTTEGQQWGANFTHDGSRYYAGLNDFGSYTIWPYSLSGALVDDSITTANSLAPETLNERLDAALKEGVANA